MEEVLLTTTEIVVVLWLPAASVATALKVCVPFAVWVEFQVTVYGGLRMLLPRFVPSSLNSTPVTAMSSEAVAEIATEPTTDDPFLGEMKEIVGGVVSPVPAA